MMPPSTAQRGLTRRTLVGLLAGLLPWTVSRQPSVPEAEQGPGPATTYWADDDTVCHVIRHHATDVWSPSQWERLAIDARPLEAVPIKGVGWVCQRRVPRWEALAHDTTPQPSPIDTRPLSGDGDGPFIEVSYWNPSDVAHCRLCSTCNALPAALRPGLMVCTRAITV